MKKIPFKILLGLLKQKNLSVEDYIEYTRLEKDMVEKWKEEDNVPVFALVMARDMIRFIDDREYVPEERDFTPVEGYDEKELREIAAAFWGTGYDPNFIIAFIKRAQEEIPEKLFKKILNTPLKYGIKRK